MTAFSKGKENVALGYSRTRIKERRIKETFGYKKRFHPSDFMQVRLSTFIGQLIKESMDKRNPFLIAQFYPSLTVFIALQVSSKIASTGKEGYCNENATT